MHDIVLTTLNARYWHSAFGLRYLQANMGSLRDRSCILEFGIKDSPLEIVADVLDRQPRIVGIGVYIWNVEQVTHLVSDLKRVAPHVIVVLGGPEVSYETEGQAVVALADYVICGEADLAFGRLCQSILDGNLPTTKTITAELPQFQQLDLPYALYSDEDIAHRVIYVEVSRGCPFTCEFCLSALEIPVRLADLTTFLVAMQTLLDRGARQFKFVDRTFNLNLRVSATILEFFLQRLVPNLFLHFEMIPDRLPDRLKTLIAQFPPAALQFEIGVQTFNDDVGKLISRPQDNDKLEQNFRFLRSETGVHIHADLIVGLPGESIESFATGFDRLVQLDPQEIQVGILKRLRGTPIVRHDETWEMVYSDHPPYEILATRLISFAQMQRLRRFARYWDLIANSGNFVASRAMLWDGGSPFKGFMAFCDWLFEQEQRMHGIPLTKLAERVFQFLVQNGHPADQVAAAVWLDYQRGGRHDMPHFLRKFDLPMPPRRTDSGGPRRQARHAQ